jgi:uncharacterized protein (TIGR03083 family)
MPSLGDFAVLGVIEHDRAEIRERVVGAWDEFLRVARGVDMQTESRLRGWRAHEICVHLASWDDRQPIAGVLAAARAASQGRVAEPPPDPDEGNEVVVAAHRDADRDEVIAALERARDDAAAYLDSPEPQELDKVLVVSTVGPLPALTILHAQVYELAVHSLDLAACGAPKPDPSLLDAGLAAMTDAAGALAARVGITSTAGIRSEAGSWAFRSSTDGWQIGRWGGSGAASAFGGKMPVRVDAPAAVLLEASAGRINPLKAVVTRRMKIHGLPGLMGLAPIVETVPGIPGAPALRLAAKGLAGAGGALGRLTRH